MKNGVMKVASLMVMVSYILENPLPVTPLLCRSIVLGGWSVLLRYDQPIPQGPDVSPPQLPVPQCIPYRLGLEVVCFAPFVEEAVVSNSLWCGIEDLELLGSPQRED